MKKLISILLAMSLLSLMILTGCANSKPASDEITTLTMWHVYGSQTESPLNDAIDEFNTTVGKDNGIFIKVTSVTDSSDIDNALTASLEEEPGAVSLPDLFTAYPRMAEKFDDGQLLNWADYFSDKELQSYREDFLSEGYFSDKLLMIPIAKSSELLFVNKTLFDRFAAANGIADDCFSSIENISSAANLYYDWSGGKSMLQINDFYHYFLVNMSGLDSEFIMDGKINTLSPAFKSAFEPIARAGIYGGLCVGDGYASDRWKTGEIISSIGSTAGILYMRDYVTYDDNTTEDIETSALPYPCLSNAKSNVVQRGGGLFAVKSEDEQKNEAAAVFAKWITEKQHNLDFVTKAGYLPVTDSAFEALFENTDTVENAKYKMLYNAVNDQYDNGYTFCSLPLFDGASDTQKDFEKVIKSSLSKAHDEYVKRITDGENKDAVMNALIESSFSAVCEELK